MTPRVGLSGLEHLIAVCRAHNLRVEEDPALPGRPPLKEALFGQLVDPLLREIWSRFSRLACEELYLPLMDTMDGIESRNQRLREIDQRFPEVDDKLLQNVLLYARFSGLPYSLATVPALADSNGLQPVVFIILDTEREVMPVASSVDMAFELYARYVEANVARDAALIAQYGSLKQGYLAKHRLHFPDSVPEIIATDRRLVEMLEANRFDFFSKISPNLPAWSARVQQAARGR